MRSSVRSIALFVTALIPFQAHAVFECSVSVKNVLVYANGAVNVLHSGRGDYTVICNMQVDYGGVSPSTCAMWTAMLQLIKKKNGTANFYYPGTGSCSTLPTYGSAPVPTYIGDVTP
jgi:hypothetical protein